MNLQRELSLRYSGQAKAYQDLWSPLLLPLSEGLVGELSKQEARRVLDCGAGSGGLLPGLSRAFPRAGVLAVDRSPGMLSRVPGTASRAVMDAGRLGFKDGTFDVVTMVFMLFHLPEPVVGLREARRVLCPGGRVGTATWGSEFESPAAEIWNRALDDLGAAPLESFTNLARHDLVDDPDKVRDLLREAGFSGARAWAEQHRCRVEADHLIRLRTGLGRLKLRYDSLSLEAQHRCVDECRQQFSRLPPEAFLHEVRVVIGIAEA